MALNETSEVRQEAQRAASEVSALLDAGQIDDALNLASKYARMLMTNKYTDRRPTDPPSWEGPTWPELLIRIFPHINGWQTRQGILVEARQQIANAVGNMVVAAILSLRSGNRCAPAILALKAAGIMEKNDIPPPYVWQEWCAVWKQITGNNWPTGAMDEEK